MRQDERTVIVVDVWEVEITLRRRTDSNVLNDVAARVETTAD